MCCYTTLNNNQHVINLQIHETKKDKLLEYYKYITGMIKKTDDTRHRELLKQKEELENNRPHDIDAMRRWKHTMGKILEELELFKK